MGALSRDLGDYVRWRMFVVGVPISQRVLGVIAMGVCKYLNKAGVVFIQEATFSLRSSEGCFRISYALPVERIRKGIKRFRD